VTTLIPNPAARVKERSARTVPCSVIETPLGFALVATRAIAAGESILEIEGRPQQEPTRYSIQIAHGTHIEADGALPHEEMCARHPWRFLNHACEPNAHIAGRSLVARAAIAAGSQITFDYTTTEADMAEPFACQCGAASCLGSVRGFAHLSADERRAREPWLAPHLRDALPR